MSVTPDKNFISAQTFRWRLNLRNSKKYESSSFLSVEVRFWWCHVKTIYYQFPLQRDIVNSVLRGEVNNHRIDAAHMQIRVRKLAVLHVYNVWMSWSEMGINVWIKCSVCHPCSGLPYICFGPFSPKYPDLNSLNLPWTKCMNNVGRIGSLANFNPSKRSPAKFSVLYHT